jgi:phosphohistidine phosphatase SixA
MIFMVLGCPVRHAEKEPSPGDRGLTPAGHKQAARTGRWRHRRGVHAVYTSHVARTGKAGCIASVTGLAVQATPGCGNYT